jgi:hypothetical protein
LILRLLTLIAPIVFAGVLPGARSWADDPRLGDAARRSDEFFEGKVRPVLVEQCQKCHGAVKQEGGLRLDSRQALLKGSDNGEVVVLGDPDQSPLIEAVRRTGPIKMPPKRELPRAVVADLEQWIKSGAPWPAGSRSNPSPAGPQAAWKRHWAFQPVEQPALPEVQDKAWPKTPIDRFILANLETMGLAPSPAADRRTLIRRASFDLIGLPPSPEQVEDFQADRSPDAFAKVVDRLLASPHYGERWGRHWLDVARYADTKGYVFLDEPNYPWAYTYRDYVIRSLNQDLPYDRFLIEQLAADRLPVGDDKRALSALGFLTVGGRVMNNAQDILDDRIDVVTRGLMGLTVSCARCHDHKFDPVPTEDYYSLYGVFVASTEPAVPPLFEPAPKTEAYAKFAAELDAREERLAEFIRAKHEEVVNSSRKRAAEYLLAALLAKDRPNTEDFMLLADGTDLNPTMIVRWQAYLERTGRRSHPVFQPWHELTALPDQGFASAARGLIESWVKSPDPARPINSMLLEELRTAPPRSKEALAQLYGKLLNRAGAVWLEWSERARLNSAQPGPSPFPAIDELSLVFHGPDAPPDLPFNPRGDLALLPDRPSQAKQKELLKAIETWRASGAGAPPRAMALEDTPSAEPQRVFVRGNPNNLGKPVPRQFLSVVAGQGRQPFTQGSGRLELARAIADRANPLTARVLVNRVWMHHFGTPLVSTPSDFGLRSEPPSHPELLDHLATGFIESGWSIKALHRQLLLSAAYQQASDDRSECRGVDPENRAYWRANRRRLDFESTRDALLAVSRKLDQRVGGPSVKEIVSSANARRTLYGFVDRLNLAGLYRAFDFPDPSASNPKRDQTIVAPQALFLMNHAFVREAAERVLERPEIRDSATGEARIAAIYHDLFGRLPSLGEVRLAQEYLDHGNQGSPQWQRFVLALLLTNEFVTLD